MLQFEKQNYKLDREYVMLNICILFVSPKFAECGPTNTQYSQYTQLNV